MSKPLATKVSTPLSETVQIVLIFFIIIINAPRFLCCVAVAVKNLKGARELHTYICVL